MSLYVYTARIKILLCEDWEANENGLIKNEKMRLFKILAKHVGRLFQDCVNLRDYVTQARKAYQLQVDINLNNIMKVFAVITAVFLPLTLIAGWYGMNLICPNIVLNMLMHR